MFSARNLFLLSNVQKTKGSNVPKSICRIITVKSTECARQPLVESTSIAQTYNTICDLPG